MSESRKTVARREYLTNALNNFHVVVNYPEYDSTGNYTNAQLRCIAFVGMAAAHAALNDSQSLVAEKVVQATQADVDTAKEWLGEKLVNQIIPLLPPSSGITCPKCGFQNPMGSKFCNRDGYPLSSSQKPIPQTLSKTSSLQLIRQSAYSLRATAFQIFLDGNNVGSIRQEENFTLALHPGLHHIILRVKFTMNKSQQWSFDIAPNEKVIFYCQGTWTGIRLWKL